MRPGGRMESGWRGCSGMVAEAQERPWWVYLLECADGTYYVGITTELGRRVRQHNAGRGARYTRTRRPVTLAASITCAGRVEAMRLEARLKQLGHRAKAAYATRQAAGADTPG